MTVLEQAQAAKRASFRLASASTELKNRALSAIGDVLDRNRGSILEENRKDQEQAKKTGLKDSLFKRLVLTDKKIDQIVASVRDVERLEDPVGKTLLTRELDQGLVLRKTTVPIGVIGVIFESRPDALVQISSLCVKSGNVAILKGGSEALHSNRILFGLFVIIAFSIGLAAVLIAIGLLVVKARPIVDYFGGEGKFTNLWLPMASAVLVTLLGALMLWKAWP